MFWASVKPRENQTQGRRHKNPAGYDLFEPALWQKENQPWPYYVELFFQRKRPEMAEPIAGRRRVVVESERHNINPVSTQVRIASEPARKCKIECDRYGEEEEKGREDSEGSFRVESAEVLADRQRLYLQKAIGNEVTGERKKYPQSYPTKQNVVLR